MPDQEVYVSITGLKLKRLWHAPRFWLNAIASMAQAKSSNGCLMAEARTINGIHHTLSVWSSKDAMRAYLQAGAHLQAMRVFKSIATGKTLGFDAKHIPDWSEVHALWRDKGKEV